MNDTAFNPDYKQWKIDQLTRQLAAMTKERNRLAKIAEAAQALLEGAYDLGEDFLVPSHLMAPLSLAFDED